MNKEEFFKLKPKYKNEFKAGNININSIERLPNGVTIAEDINEFVGYDSNAEPNIVYFTKSIHGNYYIEITKKDTNLKELEQYIKLKLVFV